MTPYSTQPALLSRINERQVLRVLQANGPLSRAEVARRLGLSAPTASKAVESLLRSGFLEEEDPAEPGRGRPARRLRLARDTTQVLGLVIDAGQCRLVSAGLDGTLHESGASEFPTPGTYKELLDSAVRQATQRMERGVTTLGLGVSVPGLIDRRRERGILSPNVPITNAHSPSHDLAERLGIECVLVQEEQGLCLAERSFGGARGLDDFAMLDVSTGVGLGVMSGGRLLAGHSGLAGEIGHITVELDGRPCGCGNHGCLETVASDSALAWMVTQRLGFRVTIEDVIVLAGRGDLDPSWELARVGRYLAVGMAAVMNLFNPSALFVHGRLFAVDAGLFPRVVEETRRRALRPSFQDCRIIQARGSKRQGAVAAIIEHLTNSFVPSLIA